MCFPLQNEGRGTCRWRRVNLDAVHVCQCCQCSQCCQSTGEWSLCNVKCYSFDIGKTGQQTYSALHIYLNHINERIAHVHIYIYIPTQARTHARTHAHTHTHTHTHARMHTRDLAIPQICVLINGRLFSFPLVPTDGMHI